MGTFPWAENQILTGNVTRINKLDDYPPEASAIFEQHSAEGTKSVLNVPVRDSDNQISGCIGVHTYSYTKTWSVEDISHLRIVGDAIANLLERKRAEEMLLNAYDTTLEGWAKALELRDKETEDHSRRVTELTVILAQAMGIEGDELIHIRRGAILHDIGKMAIPDEILRKRGPLTASERKVVEQHPIRGYELLSPISFLERALEIPYCHHEHWDGSGYPRGLKGEEIPPAARIFTVVDVWDALLSDRPYSKAWPREKAIQYLKDESGKIFDPKCVYVFLELVEKGKI
jgi:putative nucleotidyltransferase with HDIG domain